MHQDSDLGEPSASPNNGCQEWSMDGTRLIGFLGIATLLVITPGPDFAMTTRSVLRGGRHAGIWTAMGVATGALFWTIAAIAGISALLRVSIVAFAVLKVAGSLYLVWLGAKSLRSAVSANPSSEVAAAHAARLEPNTTAQRYYRQGFLCNLLNPKAAVIFTSVLPQFVDVHQATAPQLAVLGGVMVGLIAAWLSFYSVVAARLAGAMKGKVRRVIDGVTGLVLVLFGAKLASE
jgi:threonine/homoserine/homoserine lactone efflux protein